MQVYKAFFKIIQKNLPQLIIYLVVFLFFAVFLANTYTSPMSTDFTQTKVNIAFINQDTGSKLVEGLKNYLKQNANLIDVPDELQKLQDALFFRHVEYIIRIPDGFTEGLLRGENVQLEKTTVPNSMTSIYMDALVNKYISTAASYFKYAEDLSQEQIVRFIDRDLSGGTEVKLVNPNLEKTKSERRAYYFNYLSYSLLAILIQGVSVVMMVYNHPDVKKRNLCSPLKIGYINFQMVLGNISFAIMTWFVMILTSFIMYGSFMFTIKGLLFILNSFVFTLTALSISYCTGNIVKSKEAMAAVANVVSLGTCFISGVFVPQAFLGRTVLKFASFTPTYWYVKSNNEIASILNLKAENIWLIFRNMLVMLGFAVFVLAVTLVMIKQKRTAE
ncbi:MAG: ABC transporter permease [Clostridia bacterium]|jgi:ABC-2 type transport system permease protein